MKKTLLLIAVALASVAAFAQQEAGKDIVAVVNGETITVADLDRMYASLSPNMRTQYDQAGGKKQFLEQYIGKRLVVQEAIKQNFERRDEIAAALRDAREAEIFDLYVRHEIASQVIPEAELMQFYEDNKERFRRPEMVKVRHILATPTEGGIVNTTGDDAKTNDEARKKIQDLSRMLQGKTVDIFAVTASRFSEDSTATEAGDLGWIDRGRFVPEFEEVAFSLEPGKVSDPVLTDFGYHVLFVEGKRPGGIPSYAEVRNEVRERLLSLRQQEVLAEVSALTMQLRRQSNIQVYTEKID